MEDSTATQLLWASAGSPDCESQESADGRCWWCGADINGEGRPVKTLSSSTVATLTRAPAHPNSSHMCRACGWSLSDWVGMPADVWRPALQSKLDGNGRASMSLGDGRGCKVLICRGGSGVLVFERPKTNAAGRKLEAEWLAARGLMADGGAGPDGLAMLADLSESEAGPLLINKFRNYDHASVDGEWSAFKVARPSDREWARGVCLDPPKGQWCMALGDGQKHAAIYAPVSDGRSMIQSIYYEGFGEVRFVPAELAALLSAVEALIMAGAHPDEVMTGRYRARGDIGLVLAKRRHEPTCARFRGGPVLALADRLRRSTNDIRNDKEADDGHTATIEREDARVPSSTERLGTNERPTDRSGAVRLPGRQLGLFG